MRDHKKWDVNWFDLLSTAGDCQEKFKIFVGSGKNRVSLTQKECKGVEGVKADKRL